jgi:inosose dehydratase
MSAKFAYAQWPWGVKSKDQFIQSCKDLQEVGFQYFESVKAFIDVFKDDIDEFKAISSAYGIKPVSFYFHLNGTRENDIDDFMAKLPFLLATGVNQVTIQPKGVRGRTANPEELSEAVQTVSELGHICKENGIIASLHNHFNTVVMIESDIDFVLQNTDPDEVFYCPDTAHLVAGGCDPVEIMRRYQERIRFTHIKDIVGQMKTGKMENGVEVYSAEIFTELGQGIIDFKSVFDILKSVHYDGYLCVELDRSRFGNKESAAMNMQFLKENWL